MIAIDGDPVNAPLPRLTFDAGGVADLAINRLWTTGCRRIGAMVGPDSNLNLAARVRQCVSGHGASCDPGQVLAVVPGSSQAVTSAMDALLNHRNGPPDGIFSR